MSAHSGLWVWVLAAVLMAAGLAVIWLSLGTPGPLARLRALGMVEEALKRAERDEDGDEEGDA